MGRVNLNLTKKTQKIKDSEWNKPIMKLPFLAACLLMPLIMGYKIDKRENELAEIEDDDDYEIILSRRPRDLSTINSNIFGFTDFESVPPKRKRGKGKKRKGKGKKRK